MKLSNYNKFWVAVTTMAALAINEGLVSGDAESIVNIVIAGVGAAGVFAVPNTGDQVADRPVKRTRRKRKPRRPSVATVQEGDGGIVRGVAE